MVDETADDEAACELGNRCPTERISVGAMSPGPVTNEELLGRASISPIHIHPKTSAVRLNFIRKSDLESGRLSVWRVGILNKENEDELKSHFRANLNAEHSLHGIFAPPANAVRNLELQPTKRAFCVIDDTESGDDEHHPAHAAIKMCEAQQPAISEDLDLKFAREVLKSAFMEHPLVT